MADNLVITIGRQFGSGGREIGTLVATRLMTMIQRKDCEDKNYTCVLKPKIYIGTSIRKVE